MNDNEIIQIIKYCFDEDAPCEGCPMFNEKFCKTELLKSSLDLIYRQKAEIERLRACISTLEVAKNRAVDTFIRKLEFKLSNNRDISAEAYQSIIEDINSVAKEIDGGRRCVIRL